MSSTQFPPANYISIYAGTAGFDPEGVAERGVETPFGDDHEAFLDSIEYVVDAHMPKAVLASMLQGVEFTAASGAGDADDLDADGKPKSRVRPDFTKSFDFNRGLRPVGRLPCTLKGKFATGLNAGADDVSLGSRVEFVDSSGSTLATSACDIAMDVLTSTATDRNQACAVLPKALSAQMPGTGGDENLLRIMIEAAGYNNLCDFVLGGATDTAGATKKLNDLLASMTEAAGATHERGDFESSAATAPNARPLGHEIMHNLIIAEPLDLSSAATNNVGPGKLWDVTYDASAPDGVDGIRLNDSSLMTKSVVLQFVLSTSLQMTLRNGSTVSSIATPALQADQSTSNTDKVMILYNIIFDEAASELDLGNNVSVTVDPLSSVAVAADTTLIAV